MDSFYIRKKTGKITFYPFRLSKLIKQPFFGIINLTIKTIGGCFMFKVYNTQEDIARGLSDIFQEIIPNIRKTQLKIIPYIIHGMIISESLVPLDIAKVLKGDFSLIQLQSVIKRIKRLFVNKHFNPYDFYDKIIRYVITNYKKKHKDKRVHIVFDHMYVKDHFTVLLFSMRVGKQGIPLWFRCFEGKDCPDAFKEELITDGISYVASLFDDDMDLIYLADRWFNSTSIMEHIKSLGKTYVIRLKKNLSILHFDKKDGHKVWKTLEELPKYKYHAQIYKNVELTEKLHITNIVISNSVDTDEPWILATNKNPTRAIKDYGYRFGGIESIFKNQKSNGFYLENSIACTLKYFKSEYCFSCIGILFLTILGTDYVKNTRSYKNTKIRTHITVRGIKTRTLSLFNTGLTLFHRAFESLKYVRLSFRFILYDA